jgi:hypothetical protein
MTITAPARPLWRTWFVAVTLGEFVGFLVPACAGALFVESVLVLVAAGAVEGALLGTAQALVLRRVLPALSVRAWIAATAAAAALAWSVGLVPGLLGERLAALSVGLLVVGATIGGLVLVASIGTAQWLVLRRHVPRAWRWIPATAAAWLAGLGVFVAVATPLWQPGQPSWLIALIGAAGGLAMAATVAAVTGLAVVRLMTCVEEGRR